MTGRTLTCHVGVTADKRVFALDAETGEMLWDTGNRADDVIHLLGVAGGNLLASGECLYWFNIGQLWQALWSTCGPIPEARTMAVLDVGSWLETMSIGRRAKESTSSISARASCIG